MPNKHFDKFLYIVYIFGLLLLSCLNQARSQVDIHIQAWSDTSVPDSIRFEAFNKFYNKHIYVQPTAILEYVDAH